MIRALYLDHDHVSGLIRGLLCWGCNAAEGRSATRAYRYLAYRERNPAVILGFAVPYFSTFQIRGKSNDRLLRIELSAPVNLLDDDAVKAAMRQWAASNAELAGSPSQATLADATAAGDRYASALKASGREVPDLLSELLIAWRSQQRTPPAAR